MIKVLARYVFQKNPGVKPLRNRMNNLPILGIIAGGGNLPIQLIEHCQKTKRSFFVISFKGNLSFDDKLSPEARKEIPRAVVKIGAVGEALAHLRSAGVKEIVMVGGIKRPPVTVWLDATGRTLFKKMGKAVFSGDDTVLKVVTAFLEEEGFTVVGVESILSGIAADVGVIGKISPNRKAKADIDIGMMAAKELGALDIGQGVMVENKMILAREAEDGTDAMIARCAKLRKGNKKSGVLVKAKKPQQEEKVDLPSIGVKTIENLHAAGFCGVAIEAGGLLIEKSELIKKANEYGIFVVGVRYE